MKSAQVEVHNPHGLHARPAAEFVRTAARFRSRIEIRNVTAGRPAANAKSMMAVLAVGVSKGHVVELTATGDDEEDAIAGLVSAIEAGLGDTLEA